MIHFPLFFDIYPKKACFKSILGHYFEVICPYDGWRVSYGYQLSSLPPPNHEVL